MFAKILHANDGSDRAFRALTAALETAKQCKAELHMICVETGDCLSSKAVAGYAPLARSQRATSASVSPPNWSRGPCARTAPVFTT